MNEPKRGPAITTQLAAIAVLLFGCDHKISKAWDSGAKLEAKVSAQTCPSATPTSCPPDKGIQALPSCSLLADIGFNAVVEMDLVGSAFPSLRQEPRTEIWAINCGRLCDLAILRPSNVYQSGVGESALHAQRGRVKARRGNLFEIEVEDVGRGQLTVDIDKRSVSYRLTNDAGGRVTGEGRCPDGAP